MLTNCQQQLLVELNSFCFQRFISKEDVCAHLEFIAKNEKINISKEAIEIIAGRGEVFATAFHYLGRKFDVFAYSADLLEEALGLARQKYKINALNFPAPKQNRQICKSCEMFTSFAKNKIRVLLTITFSFITEMLKTIFRDFLMLRHDLERKFKLFIEMELLSGFYILAVLSFALHF